MQHDPQRVAGGGFPTRVAQKIVEVFRKPFLINAHQLIVTTSIGIVVYPDDGSDETILLKKADIAMYQARQAGQIDTKSLQPELSDT